MPAPPTSTVLTGAALYVPKIVAVLRELGGKAKTSIVRATIVDQMSANGEEIDETEVSGEPKYQNDMRFARLHLVNAGMLETKDVSGHGVWQLSPAGWDMPLDSATAAAICGKNATGHVLHHLELGQFQIRSTHAVRR